MGRIATVDQDVETGASDTYAAGADRDLASAAVKGQLRSLVERIETLEEEKKAIADDIKDVFAEAKGNGFDTKALRAVIKLRAQDKDERAEQEAILDTYKAALGMI
ncbi:DUF2312 domain-containing protein [Rhodoplanes roseus]|uniref:UPF0335 protein CH341_18515 n=1 Tax=Rhodoplanes roseus TaxID=29409 RepID=A0A327KX96_9BRAD|nr:hypothetical protein CH341_18515 [Rhodoplanes roseus]